MRRQCPFCFDEISVNPSGKLRRHKRFVSGGTYGFSGWVHCPGSGSSAD